MAGQLVGCCSPEVDDLVQHRVDLDLPLLQAALERLVGGSALEAAGLCELELLSQRKAGEVRRLAVVGHLSILLERQTGQLHGAEEQPQPDQLGLGSTHARPRVACGSRPRLRPLL